VRVSAIVIVRKFGAATLFAVAAQIINLFLQGEMLVSRSSCAPLDPADVYITPLKPARTRLPLEGYVHCRIADWRLVVVDQLGIHLPVLFLTEMSVTITIVVAVACLLGGMAGAWTVSTGRSSKANCLRYSCKKGWQVIILPTLDKTFGCLGRD